METRKEETSSLAALNLNPETEAVLSSVISTQIPTDNLPPAEIKQTDPTSAQPEKVATADAAPAKEAAPNNVEPSAEELLKAQTEQDKFQIQQQLQQPPVAEEKTITLTVQTSDENKPTNPWYQNKTFLNVAKIGTFAAAGALLFFALKENKKPDQAVVNRLTQ